MLNGILNDLKLKYSTGNSVTKIIYINVVLFFTIILIEKLIHFPISNFLVLPREFNDFSSQIWTIFTYSWMHNTLWHLLSNMVLLYFVGQLFLRFFRDKDLITFYLFGGIAGGILFLIFPLNTNFTLAGSSAAVFALIFAIISYNPKMPVRLILIPSSFPILYFGYFFIGMDVLQIILKNENIGGSISHLGGMAFGYLYMKQFEKGNDFLGNILSKLMSIWKKNNPQKSSFKTYKNTTNTKESRVPQNDYDYNHQKVEKQKKIDAILDRISRSGYESLTKEEKDFLFKEGR